MEAKKTTTKTKAIAGLIIAVAVVLAAWGIIPDDVLQIILQIFTEMSAG